MGKPYSQLTPEEKERKKEAQKRYWAKNREKMAEKKRRHYYKYRDKYLQVERNRSYAKLYGITTEDYDRMFAEQDGKCGICGAAESIKAGNKQHFSVDHCHKTGRVRGLLCLACNHLLGRFEKHRESVFSYLAKQEKA